MTSSFSEIVKCSLWIDLLFKRILLTISVFDKVSKATLRSFFSIVYNAFFIA